MGDFNSYFFFAAAAGLMAAAVVIAIVSALIQLREGGAMMSNTPNVKDETPAAEEARGLAGTDEGVIS
ncbi:MAG: hypothetical protein WDN30_14515 [Pararobbsia sp.]